jgi:predicted transcriptional regulator
MDKNTVRKYINARDRAEEVARERIEKINKGAEKSIKKEKNASLLMKELK